MWSVLNSNPPQSLRLPYSHFFADNKDFPTTRKGEERSHFLIDLLLPGSEKKTTESDLGSEKMADIDEDVMPRGGAGPSEDVDLSDETQDFRFLTSIS